MLKNIYFQKQTSSTPLAVFRSCFGLMILLSIVRFWANGWIEDLYIKPVFYFPYYGFEFVKPLGEYTYYLFFVCGLAAILVALGLFYRISSVLLFISFTYIELIDKTNYLNHYYFISLILFLMMFMPANVSFSLDSLISKKSYSEIPKWTIDSIKLMVAILYVFAGIAKINTEWLMEALPLKIWLPVRNEMPLIGWLFNYKIIPYIFSWFGCIYDLTIPFLLWNHKTRNWAYIAVIVFHIMTSALFPIGMFPYIMIVTALIFFSDRIHIKLIHYFKRVFTKQYTTIIYHKQYAYNLLVNKLIIRIFAVFFIIQLVLPFRYLLYPGNLFWTEQGFRFSWRVMLIEKAGLAEFRIEDDNGKRIVVSNNDFLSPLQEKMMSTQPDMILQYAHFLGKFYSNGGFVNPKIYVDSYVSLNGNLGKPLINSKTDLLIENESVFHKKWILLYND